MKPTNNLFCRCNYGAIDLRPLKIAYQNDDDAFLNGYPVSAFYYRTGREHLYNDFSTKNLPQQAKLSHGAPLDLDLQRLSHGAPVHPRCF